MITKKSFTSLVTISFSLSIIFYSCYVNLFPENHLFASGDFYQVVNFKDFFDSYAYTWEDGRLGYFNNVYPYKLYYYCVYFISSLLNFSPESIAALNMFIFLSLSFFSFHFSLYYFHPKINFFTNIIFSLCYTFNGITLYNFIYTWGYTPYIIIYCFIPIYFCLLNYFLDFFGSKKFNYISLIFILILFHLVGISFANLSWFFILAISSLLTCIIKILTSDKNSNNILTFFRNYLIFIFLLTLVNIWLITPNMTNLFDQFFLVEEGKYPFSIKGWISSQSTLPLNLFMHTADILHLDSMNYLKFIPLMCSFIIFIFILTKKLYLNKTIIQSFLFLFFIILIAAKAFIPIPNFLKEFFFYDTFFLFFRSIDKTIVFFPFFFFLISAYTVELINNSFQKKILKSSIILLIFSSCYPFFTGGIKVKYDLNFNSIYNFNNAKITMVKEIPSDYYEIYDIINSDKEDFAVLGAPYNVLNSLGWQNYTKWKHVGDDPTIQFLNKNFISLNYVSLLGIGNIGHEVNQSCKRSEYSSVKNFISYLPIKYIVYHKDVHLNYISDTYKCFIELQRSGHLENIKSTENLILFRLKNNYRKIIQLEKDLLSVNVIDKNLFFNKADGSNVFYDQNTNSERIIDYIKADYTIDNKATFDLENSKLTYEKNKPTDFSISLKSDNYTNIISFSNDFNKYWKLRCLNCLDKTDIKHFKINNYANAYKVSLKDKDIGKDLKFKLEFQLEKIKDSLYLFSIFLSIIILLISIIFRFKRK